MGISKVVYGNTTLVDLTHDTVTEDTLAKGYTAHDKAGKAITGTAEVTVSDETLVIPAGFVGVS